MLSMKRRPKKESRPPERRPKTLEPKAPTPYIWTVSALNGTQDIVRDELVRRFPRDCTILSHTRDDEIHFTFAGDEHRLLSLSTAQTLLLRKDFDVIRPRSLLSPERMAAVVDLMRSAGSVKGAMAPSSFRFDAAGSESPTMRRIADQIEQHTDLPFNQKDGDCVIALRPGKTGWEVLCRVGNRPLATRDWRRVNYLGSLNAAIASCMVELARPQKGDRYLNLMCGSGTLLIERLLRQPTRTAIGIDISEKAVSATRENVKAAGLSDKAQIVTGDARATEFPDESFDTITTDLPWGENLGSRKSNLPLYRETLKEATRLCRSAGFMVVLTQDIASFNKVMSETEAWTIIDQRRIIQRGYQPLCTTLQKKP